VAKYSKHPSSSSTLGMFALNISMKVSRSEALTVMDAITFIILVAVSAIEQIHIFLATTKAAKIDVVLVQQLQVEVAKGSRFLKDGMRLVFVPTARHDHGQIVAGVTRGISSSSITWFFRVAPPSPCPCQDRRSCRS
jgi:hypothetical protein